MSVAEACESLVEALDAQRTDIVKSLLDHLAKGNEGGQADLQSVLSYQATQQGTLLHYAVHADLTDAVRALLLAGADPGIQNNSGLTVMSMVANNSLLLQVFTDELFRAVAASNCPRIDTLLKAGVQIQSVDSMLTNNTALHWAASFGSKEVVAQLIEKGAEANAVNADGCSPLHDAAQRKDLDIVKVLLNAGADPHVIALNGKLKGKTPKDLCPDDDKFSSLFATPENTNEREKRVTTNITLDTQPLIQLSANPEMVHTPIRIDSPKLCNKTNLTSPAASLRDEKLNLLWPQPLHISELVGEQCTIPPHLHLVVSCVGAGHTLHSILDIWETHRKDFNEIGYTASIKGVDQPGTVLTGPGEIEINVSDDLNNDEYTISLTSNRIRMSAGGSSGMHFAVTTLIQLLWIYRGSKVPQLIIRDKPKMSIRGILIDMAIYGRLPTLETFTATVKTLSKLKMNQVHLYLRLSPKSDWQLPFLPNDLISLDRDCYDRMIKVYPTLDIIQPCSFEELKGYSKAFSQLLSCFNSKDRIHVGPCLSSVVISSVERLGSDLVFPSLTSLFCVGASSKIILCSNSVASFPNLIDSIPSNIGFIEYGFQGSYKFHEKILTLSRTGCQQILCPGTSAWNCLVGRPLNMMENIFNAAHTAAMSNTSGLVVASWAGSPALAPIASSYPGWAMGVGLAWNSNIETDYLSMHFGNILSKHLFCDETGSSGQIILDLGRSESCIESPVPIEPGTNVLQTSVLLNVIMRPNGIDWENTSADQLGKVIQEVRRNLTKLQISREGGGGSGEGLIQEIALSAELLLVAARLARGLILTEERNIASLQLNFRTDLANKLLSLTEQYRAVWLSRYQPSGMQTSLLHLTSLLNLLLPSDSPHSQYLQPV